MRSGEELAFLCIKAYLDQVSIFDASQVFSCSSYLILDKNGSRANTFLYCLHILIIGIAIAENSIGVENLDSASTALFSMHDLY